MNGSDALDAAVNNAVFVVVLFLQFFADLSDPSCFPSFEQGARAYSKKCDSTRRFLTDGYLFTIM
jgi:hypothetical protein